MRKTGQEDAMIAGVSADQTAFPELQEAVQDDIDCALHVCQLHRRALELSEEVPAHWLALSVRSLQLARAEGRSNNAIVSADCLQVAPLAIRKVLVRHDQEHDEVDESPYLGDDERQLR